MATITLPFEVAFFINSLPTLVKIQLDHDNYITWSRQLRHALNANNLLGYVDGTIQCPDPCIAIQEEGSDRVIHTNNPAYQQWIKIDKQLLSGLMSTISISILPTIDEFDHAFELWYYIGNRFSSLSRSHIHELKTKLATTVKTGTMAEYLRTLKDLGDRLNAAGEQIKEEDMVFQTLHGLPMGYSSFKTAIRARGNPITYYELCTLLESEEVNMASELTRQSHTDTRALAA